MDPDFFRFRLGDFECVALYDGWMDYEPHDFFANAPKEEAEQFLRDHQLPTDTIITPFSYLFVDTGQHRALADMGAGPLTDNVGKLTRNMRAAGIDPSEIDTVLITHAHADHVGGDLDAEGRLVYPNARYYIWKSEWEFWFSDQAPERGGEWLTKRARIHLAPLQGRITLLEKETEVVPGIRMLPAPGHTPGHIVVDIASRGERLMYIGDVVLSPLNLERPDWTPVFDILPEQAEVSKRDIFDAAASGDVWVMGQHFPPFPSIGKVSKRETGWKWEATKPGTESAD